MVEKIIAVFDGKVFHPDAPIALKANTRVRITIETVPPDVDETASFVKKLGMLYPNNAIAGVR